MRREEGWRERFVIPKTSQMHLNGPNLWNRKLVACTRKDNAFGKKNGVWDGPELRLLKNLSTSITGDSFLLWSWDSLGNNWNYVILLTLWHVWRSTFEAMEVSRVEKIKGYEFDRLKREQLDYIVSHAWEHLNRFLSQVSSNESSQKLNRSEGHISQYILLFKKC